ncbi:MAG TPA: LOG family protein [Alphaproteobacteria bacterium]|nr:LOG family protein [Alphaproteobacteria bacterium]
MKILLFASARHISDRFFAIAGEVGTHIGQQGHMVVYGGGDVGLMGEAARAAAAAGSKVKGYVPGIFHKASPNQPHHTIQTDIVENLFIRKEKMLFDGELLLVLPGGIGTLDEAAEGLAANDIQSYIDDRAPMKPIIILNLLDDDGIRYFRGIKIQLEDMVRNKAVDPERLRMIHFAESVEEGMAVLDSYAANGIPSAACLKTGAAPAPGV